MHFEQKREGDVVYLKFLGQITQDDADRFRKVLFESLDKTVSEIVIDLAGVPVMGSAVIGKMLVFYKNAMAQNTEIRIGSINKDLELLFRSIKLDKIFPIMESSSGQED